MAQNTLEYKGYTGSIAVSVNDGVLHGKVEFINDLVTYEGESIPELKLSFEEAVDDYLETCSLIGKKPDKKLSGSFNIRIGSELHKEVALEALRSNTSINEVVKNAIEDSLGANKELHLHIHSDVHGHFKNKSTKEVSSWDYKEWPSNVVQLYGNRH